MICSIKTNYSYSTRDKVEYKDMLCLQRRYIEPRNLEILARECKGACVKIGK